MKIAIIGEVYFFFIVVSLTPMLYFCVLSSALVKPYVVLPKISTD